jgi:hypothetical protein
LCCGGFSRGLGIRKEGQNSFVSECPSVHVSEEAQMTWLWILLIIVIIIVFGLGFVVKWLFWIALVLFIVWLIFFIYDRLRRR